MTTCAPQLERRFSPAIEQDLIWAKRLHIGCERLLVVALSFWLAGCNNLDRLADKWTVCLWAEDHIDQVLRARADFDKRNQQALLDKAGFGSHLVS